LLLHLFFTLQLLIGATKRKHEPYNDAGKNVGPKSHPQSDEPQRLRPMENRLQAEMGRAG
jgi:hypothetical protein